MAQDPDSYPHPDPEAPAAKQTDPRPSHAPAPSHPPVDHIPFLYGSDPLNPIFAPPVLIEDLNADPEPATYNPDPIPDPEPPSPSLSSPDPGIFHPTTDKPRP